MFWSYYLRYMVKIKEFDLALSVIDMPTAFAPVPAPFLIYFHKQL